MQFYFVVLELLPIGLTETEVLTRLFIAMSLGALIGVERELRFSHVGIKTYSIVALGAALFTMMGVSTNTAIATGIVTGVGFLGAGAIFRANDKVHGLTTASLIWISAALGMAVGYGYYHSAVAATVMVYVVLVIIGHVEERYLEKFARKGINLEKLTSDQMEKLAELAESGIVLTNRQLRKLNKTFRKK